MSDRAGVSSWRRPALAVGVLVAVLAAVALSLTQARRELAVRPAHAIAAARRDPQMAAALRGVPFPSVSVTAVDRRLVRVVFFDHGRALAEAAVEATGRVEQGLSWRSLPVPYGNPLAYQPAVMVGLAALFVLMAGVAPWRRLRNLDVVAALSLAVPVVLLQQRYLQATVLAALPGLAYLLARCGWTALRAASPVPPGAPATPLIVALTPGLDPRARVRILRVLAIALALAYVMIGLSSSGAVDVVYAVLEGATRLLHGALPYGHMPGDVIHGDTYPLLSYLLYVPLAWASPVTSTWDSVDAGLLSAVLSALGVGWALHRAAAGPRRGRTAAAEESGLRASLAWLAFPPLLITVSTGTTDVALAAMLTAAVLLHRRPAASSGMLTAAAWFKLAPAALLPVWLAPLRGRRLAAALASIAGLSLVLLGALVALGGASGPGDMLHALAFQFSRGSPMSVWASPAAERIQPVVQAAVLGLIAGAMLRLRRNPALAEDRARMAALSAAILIGLQLAADYWAFLYLAWALPLVCLGVLHGAPASGTKPAAATLPGPSALPARAALAK